MPHENADEKLIETIRLMEDALRSADENGFPLVAAHLATAIACARNGLIVE